MTEVVSPSYVGKETSVRIEGRSKSREQDVNRAGLQHLVPRLYYVYRAQNASTTMD